MESPFVFYGENLALDLINTEVIVRGKRKDLLITPEDVERWWSEAVPRHLVSQQVIGPEARFDMELLDKVKILRNHLRRLASSIVRAQRVDSSSITSINRVLSLGVPTLNVDGEMRFRVSGNAEGALLFPVAYTMAQLLTSKDKARLHNCSNERCILYFYDNTRSATRRYCSQACLERARSAERYKLSKNRAEDD
jgi:predicted RNA-binding Zn ribbon-like protein